MGDIISKLNSLKSVEPDEKWVVESRRKILTKAPINYEISYESEEKSSALGILPLFSIVSGQTSAKRMFSQVAALCFVMIAGSFFVVSATGSSLPGDQLYSVKLANENIVLAVSSNEEDKAKVEVEIAGKRLEELAEVTKKTSDSKQEEKVEKLVNDFEKNLSSAQERLSKINGGGEKSKIAHVAKVVNSQSEKYSEILAKTSDNLPDSVRNKVSDKIASAINKTDKINTNSLLILIESRGETEEVVTDNEIAEILKKKVSKYQGDVSNSSKEDEIAVEGGDEPISRDEKDVTERSDAVSDQDDKNGVISIEAKISNSESGSDSSVNIEQEGEKKSAEDQRRALIADANESIMNNNLLDAAKTVVAIEELASGEETFNVEASKDGSDMQNADAGSENEGSVKSSRDNYGDVENDLNNYSDGEGEMNFSTEINVVE